MKVYAKGGLGFVETYGKEYQYEAVLESILAEIPGKPKYVVVVSAGNDVYGPKKTVYDEEYEDVQVGLAMAKCAARLWYQLSFPDAWLNLSALCPPPTKNMKIKKIN